IKDLNNDEEYLNVGDTLDEVLEKYSILVNQKKININKELLDYNIYIGKTALNIVFSNLISNAVKYTNRNGIINIKIANDWLLIENSYDKNKISKINKILDASFDLKLDNSNGLGLNIVKNILNKYNIKYEILHGENYFIFKIKIIS
ncbi:TPA: ATP-binding protein, partial [Streptococcus agalactiae]